MRAYLRLRTLSRSLPVLVLSLLLASGCARLKPGVHAEDPYLYKTPAENAVTFWGHSTTNIDLNKYDIVTDPVFVPSFAPLYPRYAPVPPPSAYARTRVVLISHAHHDHLSRKTLETFPENVVVLCPQHAADYLRTLDRDVRAMRPGDTYDIPGGRIVAVAAHHPGTRFGIHSTSDGDALGWIIQTENKTIYYTGDTGYFDGFEQVGDLYQPDLVLLNLTCHIHSQDALRAIHDLGMPTVVPIHYGAYSTPKEKYVAGWRQELGSWIGSRFKTLAVGESLPLASVASRYERTSTFGPTYASARTPDIPRFAHVDEGLARGGKPNERGIEYLSRHGYRTVVSFLHDPEEAERVRAAGMDYVEIPMSASLFGASTPSEEDLDRFFSVVLDSTARPVFMHCRHGKDRTGAMAALYRIEASGWTTSAAIDEMNRLGFNGMYRKLRRFVQAYAPRGFETTRQAG